MKAKSAVHGARADSGAVPGFAEVAGGCEEV